MSTSASTLSPRLVIADAARAIDFYREAFGAELYERFDNADGTVVHAGLRIGESTFSVTEQDLTWRSPGPAALGGSPVILSLTCDADLVWARAVALGAVVVFPLKDHDYGFYEGRLTDPFGHVWIISGGPNKAQR